jgi:hypothetical protein
MREDIAAQLAELDAAKAERERALAGQPHPVMVAAWSTSGIWLHPSEGRRKVMRQRCGRIRAELT